MKAFPIVKSFTLVSVFLFTTIGWGQTVAELATEREKCKAKISYESKVDDCKLQFTATTPEQAQNIRNCAIKAQKDDIETCVSDFKSATKDARSESDKEKTSCTTLENDVSKARSEISKQCGLIDVKNATECEAKAISCAKGIDPALAGNESGDESDIEKALKTIYSINTPETSPGANAACMITDDDKSADKEERQIEKISKLRADIASLAEDTAKADDDVAKKKQDVEEKIVEIEKDMDKKKNEKKTEEQKETAKMQQDALDAVKRKSAAIKAIEKSNREIANLQLQQQEEAIQFSQSIAMKDCRDQAMAIKTKMIAEASAPGAQKGIAATGQIKKDVELFAKTCIKIAAVKKSKAMKATQDRINMENSNIKELQDAIKLDGQAAANRLKDLEARTKIIGEDMTKAEERRTQELTALNQKVMDMQQLVEKKKQTLAEKIKAKEDEKQAIILKMHDKKARFTTVATAVDDSRSKVVSFVSQCCDFVDSSSKKTPYQATCERLKTDFPKEASSVTIKKPVKPKTTK